MVVRTNKQQNVITVLMQKEKGVNGVQLGMVS